MFILEVKKILAKSPSQNLFFVSQKPWYISDENYEIINKGIDLSVNFFIYYFTPNFPFTFAGKQSM